MEDLFSHAVIALFMVKINCYCLGSVWGGGGGGGLQCEMGQAGMRVGSGAGCDAAQMVIILEQVLMIVLE